MSYIFSIETDIISANLTNNNLDDVNFNEDDYDTITHARLIDVIDLNIDHLKNI